MKTRSFFFTRVVVILWIVLFGINAIADPKKININSIKTFFDQRFKNYKNKQVLGERILSPNSVKRLYLVEFPLEDMPDEEKAKLLENEDPEAFYYGYGGEIDYEKARLIAYSHLGKTPKGERLSLAALSVLMMIYGNGQGVKSNFELAQFFAVVEGGSHFELTGELMDLEERKSKGWKGEEFSFCDHTTSGFREGYCKRIHRDLQRFRHNKAFLILSQHWTPPQIQAFERLKKKALRYFLSQSQNEIDGSGSAGTAFILEEEMNHHDAFKKLIEQLEENEISSFSKEEFDESNKNLKTACKDACEYLVRSEEKFIDLIGFKKEDLKKTQQDWAQYRDAFFNFSRVRYPKVSKNTLGKILTDMRIEELQRIRGCPLTNPYAI
ncbi:MAG: hypothetical protein A2977_00135 [Alphaproteobacteria bacterium RIFCSPLOWO2_01_FULL_45_8]|nr:MAG: hypothetical protein A3K20_04910 [Alphaproteobacteria bacterium GWA1_45_9]OFW89552.1 MAG: hypothetical protein A2621_01365 [Alphaproteobacteria bacterium RIFCSPHIGHO2_01_FULL_41_14]OFW96454.1 MAG: hypothetical protein A2977_00135 [Alphaproteobacteria bacterium RIFCSPLOWO2_01_FULL_45_8]HCI48877.1 hypothetical protein [Holosporales bacterium]HLB58925.1 hypothetical protein [Bdellovibrionota bacterium]